MTKFVLIAAVLLILSAGGGQIAQAGETDVLVLVNRDHSLESGYSPENMVNIARHVPASRSEVLLRYEAAEAFLEMIAVMEWEGIPIPIAVSGYRTYEHQTNLFARRIQRFIDEEGLDPDEAYTRAATVVARPGTSEHQTGLAIDLSMDGSLSSAFASTETGRWLNQNSWRFGFILRYPEDRIYITGIIYEPWHFRYVGVPHAGIMFENGWVLEEYIDVIANGEDIWTLR